MSVIHLQRAHKLGLRKARVAAQKVADDLADDFDMQSRWEGNALTFSRSGVSGSLVVSRDRVVLEAKLGLLLVAFRSRIEQRLHDDFERYFT